MTRGVGMPGMNGLEVARRTREAGFDYHLVKPADVGMLQSILSMREADPAHLVKH